MRRLFLPLILFLLLTSEGIAVKFFPYALFSANILVAAHWVFIFLLLILLLYDTDDTFFAVIYAIFFGIMIDAIYTGVLGVYMFVYPATLYLLHLAKKFLQTNLFVVIIFGLVGLSIVEVSLFFMNTLISSLQMNFTHFLSYRLIPTLIANIIFLSIMYGLTAKRLVLYRKKQLENNDV